MYDPHGQQPVQPPGAGYPPPSGPSYPPPQPPAGYVPQQPGSGYPMPPPGAAQSASRPPAVLVVAGLVLLGALLTFVSWYLDRRLLSQMFFGNGDAQDILPTFSTVRLVVDIVGVLVALGLLIPAFLGLNWGRVVLAVACCVYALANLGAALASGFLLVAGQGAFNEGHDSVVKNVGLLNGASLVVDLALLLVVVFCVVLLFSGPVKAYARARAGAR